nr:hypothetical protein [Tanacetum cinerariifolium]
MVITESSVRRDLQLADEEGIDYLSNSTIFEQLALIGLGKGFSSRVTPLFQIMVIQNQSELGEGLVMPTNPHHTPIILQPSSHLKRNNNLGSLNERTLRVVTTASSLEAEQDSGNINKTKSKATSNESSSQKTNSGGGPRWQETIRDTIAQTRVESVSKHSNDSLLVTGNILQSDKDRLKLDELMALCTNLQNRVLELEKTKTTQHNEIVSLKRMVKKLEKKNRSKTHKLKRLYKVGLSARVESSRDEESLGKDASKHRRIDAIDVDEYITLVIIQDDANKELFDVNVLDGDEVFVAGKNENVVEEIVDVAHVKLGKSKTTTTTTISSQQSQGKGKQIMIEEPSKPKKKDQIRLYEEASLKLQAKFDKEERLAREKDKKEQEANIALIEEWDNIQAKIDVDHQLAKRLQAQE